MDRLKASYERMVKFFQDTRAELRRVIWPTRRETIVYTSVVIVAVVVFGAVIWGVDNVLSLGLQAVLRQ
ncbi:MAG: preprotein translocase subunit SecE [Firmicutes bacterium]|nr:preprotein translocase subunit SecE [Bacillota bacterium]